MSWKCILLWVLIEVNPQNEHPRNVNFLRIRTKDPMGMQIILFQFFLFSILCVLKQLPCDGWVGFPHFLFWTHRAEGGQSCDQELTQTPSQYCCYLAGVKHVCFRFSLLLGCITVMFFFSLWLLLRLQSDKHFHSAIDVKFCGSKSLLMLYTSSLYGTYITQIWQWTDTPCVSFAEWLQYWHCVGQNNSKDRYLKVFIYENCS